MSDLNPNTISLMNIFIAQIGLTKGRFNFYAYSYETIVICSFLTKVAVALLELQKKKRMMLYLQVKISISKANLRTNKFTYNR